MPRETGESSGTPPIGPRIRGLRGAEDLSLRGLAERSGVSAPMLSQVERGETSPTLAVAGRIAAGLELRLSQLLRPDEAGAPPLGPPPGRRHGGRPRPPDQPADPPPSRDPVGGLPP